MTTSNTTLLIGPVAGGKTSAMLERLAAPRQGRAVLLVPGGLHYERARAQTQGLWQVRVDTFESLARLVLESAGQEVLALVNDMVRTLLLRSLLRHLTEAGKLPRLGKVAHKAGFVATVANLIEEARNAEIAPNALTTAVLTPYDGELGALYAAYCAALQDLGQTDLPGRLDLARAALQSSTPQQPLLADLSLLVVDGFDQFTPLQLGLLAALMPQADQCIITLTGETTERPAHRRFVRTRQQLEARLSPVVELLDPAHTRAAAQIRHPLLPAIAARLFDLHPTPSSIASPAEKLPLLLMKAADREREVRAVLRQVRHLIDREGAPPDEIALLLRSGAAYVPLLREVAAEYDLPLAISHGLPLLEAPPVVALLSLLRLRLEDYPCRLLGEVWRSFADGRLTSSHPLPFIAGLSMSLERAASLIQRVAREAGIAGGLARLRATLRILSEQQPDPVPDDDETRAPAASPDEARQLLALLDAFESWLTPPTRASIADYVGWLEGLSLNLPPEAVADEPRDLPQMAAQRWWQVLRSLAAAADLLQEPEVTFGGWVQEVFRAAGGAQYGQDNPLQSGKVAVLPVLAARGLQFDHVLLLGMTDGEFPLKLPQPPIYSRRERALLAQRGVPLLPPDPADERSLFYETIGRARRSLTLSYTYLDEQGNELYLSPFVQAICDLLPGKKMPTITIGAGSVPDESQAVSVQEHLLAAMAASAKTCDPAPPDLFAHVQHACQIERAREGTGPYGIHEGIITDGDLQVWLAEQFGASHLWSVTQFNDYITCPFRFAAAHIFKLQPPGEPEEGLARVGRGRIYHRVLRKAGEEWRQRKLKLVSDNEQTLLDVLLAAADDVLDRASEQPDVMQGAFWEWEQVDVRRSLEQALRRLIANPGEWADFQVAAVERGFGPMYSGGTPPLTLTTSAGQVRVVGRIDRIDQHPDMSLAVLDYKSSSSPRSLNETTSGRDVQLPIYLLAAEQLFAAHGQRVTRAAFVHLGSGKRSAPLTEKDREATLQAMHERVAEVVAGARQGDFAVRPRDDCPPACAFVHICRRNFAKRDAQQQA